MNLVICECIKATDNMWISTGLKFITKLKTLLHTKRSGSTLPVMLKKGSDEKGKTYNCLCCC